MQRYQAIRNFVNRIYQLNRKQLFAQAKIEGIKAYPRDSNQIIRSKIITKFQNQLKTINYIPVSKIDEPAKQIIESPPAKEETLIEKKNRLMKIQNTNSMSSEPPQEKVEYNFNVRRTGNSNMPKNKIINNNTLENEGGKKIPVTQRLILFDGDPMVNAKVLVKNDKDEVIKTVETSSAGRWQVALSPGKYSVNVSGKHGGSTIGFNQSFEVPDMNSPLDLPSPKAYKKIK